MTEKDIINFATWYSGMHRQKVQKAYERYLREVNKLNLTPIIVSLPLTDEDCRILNLPLIHNS